MSRNTKVEIAKREERTPGAKNDYMSSSPAAAYDSTRNKRNIEARLGDREDLIYQHNANDNTDYQMSGGPGANPTSEGNPSVASGGYPKLDNKDNN